MDVEIPDINLIDPVRLVKSYPNNPELIAQTIVYLKSNLAAIQEKITALRQELSNCYRDIEAIYDIPEMREHPYFLHAILVHSGFADGGHYFTYIYDRVMNLWRKYSDIDVSVVESEEVFENSIGGQGHVSAYCLVYIDESTATFENRPIHRDFPIQAPGFFIENTYTEWINEALRLEIADDNQRLVEQIEEQRVGQETKQIQDLYTQRWSKHYLAISNAREQQSGKAF